MPRLAFWIPLLVLASFVPCEACLSCNFQVRAGIFNGSFLRNLALVFLPFPLVGLLILSIHRRQ